MKAIIAALIVAVIIPTSAFAGAQWSQRSNGVWCKSMSGGIGCVKTDGTGYGIGMHKDFVFVQDNATSKIVFKRFH
jgi:hypothetical protein